MNPEDHAHLKTSPLLTRSGWESLLPLPQGLDRSLSYAIFVRCLFWMTVLNSISPFSNALRMAKSRSKLFFSLMLYTVIWKDRHDIDRSKNRIACRRGYIWQRNLGWSILEEYLGERVAVLFKDFSVLEINEVTPGLLRTVVRWRKRIRLKQL